MATFNHDDLTPEIVKNDVVAWLKTELRRAYNKEMLEQATGPFIYGDGNFEVYQDKDLEWQIRPIEGWKPRRLQGIEYFTKEK